jgi:DNA ligase-3
LICKKIAEESSHLKKSSILSDFFKNGVEKGTFKGNVYLVMKLLIPNSTNRVYNLNSKQLVKLFSKIFATDQDEMLDHLNKGDVADTIRHYFSKSNKVKPSSESTLTLDDIDSYLEKLTEVTKENDQLKCLEEIAKNCTKNDLQMFIRLIKKDLRIDAGASVLLDAINPKAYAAYQVSNNLKDVIERSNQLDSKNGLKKDLSIKVNLMTAIKPMLADACKSVEQAFLKCKNEILAEVKYDGERLQIHKNNDTFTYYSRNLKAVQPHKTEYLKEYIPKAFPNAKQLILDGEILLYCSKTKKPLPFGSLGVHKKNAFKEATVCLFVFDCIYLVSKKIKF